MVTRSSTTFRTLQLSCVVSWLPYMFVVAPPPPLTKRSLLHETHRENQNAKAPLSAHHPRASMELIKCEWWPDPSCSCIPDVVSSAQHLLPHFDQPVISFCSSAWELILFFFYFAVRNQRTQHSNYQLLQFDPEWSWNRLILEKVKPLFTWHLSSLQSPSWMIDKHCLQLLTDLFVKIASCISITFQALHKAVPLQYLI